MPIVEYKQEITYDGKRKPAYVRSGGQYKSVIDNTLIGWIEENPDYYIPPLKILNKSQFAERQVEIHKKQPFMKSTLKNEVDIENLSEEEINALEYDEKKMTIAEVKEMAGKQYEDLIQFYKTKFGTE